MTRIINFLTTPINKWAARDYITLSTSMSVFVVHTPYTEALNAWLMLLTPNILQYRVRLDIMDAPAVAEWMYQGTIVVRQHIGLDTYRVYEHGLYEMQQTYVYNRWG